MGNRAVITTRENFNNNGIGIYLHWNGGRDSVEAFLKYCDLKGYRTPTTDCYGWARLTQVIANFFGGGDSVGIDVIKHLDCDNWDNGVYIIDKWEIVGREFFQGSEQNEYKLDEMLLAIDEAQPENEQIGDFLKAKELPVEDVKIGDEIVYIDWNGKQIRGEVVGIGEDKMINGRHVFGVPYINEYRKDDPASNINNYLIDTYFRVAKKEV